MDENTQRTISILAEKVQELLDWKEARENQQITTPVDDASKAALGALTRFGPGSTGLTQNIAIGAVPTSITVPVAFTKSVVIKGEGFTYEVPVIA